jgi:hypothetical protein
VLTRVIIPRRKRESVKERRSGVSDYQVVCRRRGLDARRQEGDEGEGLCSFGQHVGT